MLVMNFIYIMLTAFLLYMYKCRQKPSNKPNPTSNKVKPKLEKEEDDDDTHWGYFVFIDE